jgi:co-chaperonin GroES (HSP10)
MSGIILEGVMANPVAAATIAMAGEAGEAARERLADEAQKARQLPKPVGYHMLVAIPEAAAEFDNGLLKADVTRSIEEVSTVVGFVVDMGPECYADKGKFPTGPWCKKGDFVLMRAYSGTRFKIHGKEWRILNDDSIEAVVEDPRGISRI